MLGSHDPGPANTAVQGCCLPPAAGPDPPLDRPPSRVRGRARRGRAKAAGIPPWRRPPLGDKVKGKVKETAGKAVGNERLEAEGKGDQIKGDVKQAGEKVRDAFKD